MHLNYQERVKIYRGLCEQKSVRNIANLLGRSPSTISREIKRNSDTIGYLYPEEAHRNQQQKMKRSKTYKIERDYNLKDYIINKLKQRWSPKVIAGRWNLENKKVKITHETIYRWIYKKENKHFIELLPRAKRNRGFFRRKMNKTTIPDRISIHKRPPDIERRETIGHFEVDTVFHQGSMSYNLFTAIDRKSRFVFVHKNTSKKSMEVIDGLLKNSPKYRIQSITFDNGTEFSAHSLLRRHCMIQTYFCDPGKPWQKGSIEHFNGMFRRRIPFHVPLNQISQQTIDSVVHQLNHMPRESLGFKTPCEAFNQTSLTENNQCCVS